jgi:hypothetical protein
MNRAAIHAVHLGVSVERYLKTTLGVSLYTDFTPTLHCIELISWVYAFVCFAIHADSPLFDGPFDTNVKIHNSFTQLFVHPNNIDIK